MRSLGFMTLNMNSEQQYFDEIAKRAVHFEIECYKFIPSQIDPKTEFVTGLYYEHIKNQWIERTFKLPEIIYDRCFYGDDLHSKQCLPITSWLKLRKDIQFLGYGLPNKIEIYDKLLDSKLAPYLPATKPLHTAKDLYSVLFGFDEVIIKPITGYRGYGIYKISQQQKEFRVETHKSEKKIVHQFSSKDIFESWINILIKTRPYLIQPYLQLSDMQKRPFDIRCLLQKDQNHQWQERGRGVRIGMEGGLISNVSAGADIIVFDEWIQKIGYSKRQYIRDEIADILAKLPFELEDKFQSLFELGIDIGMAKDYSLWILDMNSKPGRKVVLSTDPLQNETLYTAPLHYATSLFCQLEKGKEGTHEKTLPH